MYELMTRAFELIENDHVKFATNANGDLTVEHVPTAARQSRSTERWHCQWVQPVFRVPPDGKLVVHLCY